MICGNDRQMTKELITIPVAESIARVYRLRIAAIVEGVTLLILLAVAVPLKHIAGLPIVVSVMGPFHGIAFLLYLWMVINVAFNEDWSKTEVVRLVLGALVPFGAVLSISFLNSKQAATANSLR
jgi:integral membrane protein